MEKQTELADFEPFFHKYKNLVYKTAYSILGDGRAAEDVMQEVFIKAYKSGGYLYPERGRFDSWLYRLTSNQCISSYRKKRLPFTSFELLTEDGFQFADDEASLPEEILMSKERRATIRQALELLDKKHRAVLTLRYFNSLTYDEIALLLKIPLGTVKSRVHKAMKAFHERLQEKKWELR